MTESTSDDPRGAGLGFRLKLADELLRREHTPVRFIEVAPENYLGVGGKRGRLLRAAAERWPVVSHGLCGDFAGAEPIDREFLGELRTFLSDAGARWYSDHLCYTHAAGAALHDLIPLPMNGDAVKRSAERIVATRELLGLPIAVENASAYMEMPGGEMDEPTFVRSVLEEADCLMLLDVNNVYVNSENFGFDPDWYIDQLPLERVVQIHVAGHHVEDDGLRIDTHGAPIIDPVYALLERTLPKLPDAVPVLLERDHNIPPLKELEAELQKLQGIVDETDAIRGQGGAA